MYAHEKTVIAEVYVEEGLEIIGWRVVPVRSEILGKASAECEPAMEQLFVKRPSKLNEVYLLRETLSCS